jgi:DNA polymerase-1
LSDIKSCFVSRFPDGVILECDFSQLEVVGLALLSEDPVLIEDLLAGRDMHRYFAARLFNKEEKDVTPSERSLTKKLSFALQYGSGANGLAKKNGISNEKAQEFIDYYYDRYKRVKEWQNEVYSGVVASRVTTGDTTPRGYPRGRGEHHSPTGRVYTFLEKDKPEGWRGDDATPDFNPPEIKNYPIQGFATGDVMALFRARLYREWVGASNRSSWLPVNTVHDSVMFDCESLSVAYDVKLLLEKVAASLEKELYDAWGLVAPVPFKVETKAGPSWQSTEKI